jgi:pilus assembly protein Flp/PilA
MDVSTSVSIVTWPWPRFNARHGFCFCQQVRRKGLLGPYISTLQNLYRREVRTMLYQPREEGQGLVEYALILVLVAIVVIAILTLLGPQIANIFSRVTNALTGT